MMPPEELVTLSPARPEPVTTDPTLRFIILLGLLDAFGPLGIDMYLPAFPQIEHDLNARAGAMQLTLSLFLAGLAIGQLICGPISDRVGRRLPLLYGAALLPCFADVCLCPVDRGTYSRSIRDGFGRVDRHGRRAGRRPRLV